MALAFTLYLLVPLLSLLGMKINKSNDRNSLSIDTTTTARGVGMIMIIFSHGVVETAITNVTFFYSVSAILGVSLCFLVSGYGLYFGYENKTKYLDGFISKKIVKLLLPYFVLYVIFLIYDIINGGLNFKDVLLEIITLRMNGMMLWYLKIQLLLYLLFFLVYKYIPKEKTKLPLLFILVIAYIIIMWIVKVEMYWYNTVLFFSLGCLLCKFKDKLIPFIKNKAIIALASIGTCGVFLIIYLFGKFGLDYFVDSIYMLAFNIAVLGVLSYLSNSKLLGFIGKYSLEIYLFHCLLLSINPFGFFDATKWYSYVLLLIITCAISLAINFVCNKVYKLIFNKNK